jgi:uncharacterized protein YukE
MDRLDECKQDVVVAAQEEREAYKALTGGRGPMDHDWSPDEAPAYRARLDRWRNASNALAEALDRLEREQRASDVPRAAHGGASAAS